VIEDFPLRFLRSTATVPAQLIRSALIAASLLAGHHSFAATAAADPVAVEIQHRLGIAGDDLGIDRELLDGGALRSLYQPRQWRPIWSDQADQLMAVLSASDLEGLPPERFHVKAITAKRAQKTPAAQAEADMLMTDGVLRYASAMRGQRVDPRDIEDDWLLVPASFDATPYVRDHIKDIVPALQALQPPYAGYQLLRHQLARLRAVAAAGDWPKVPQLPLPPPVPAISPAAAAAPGTATAQPPAPVVQSLKPGTSDERIPFVRRRLEATGELAAGQPMTNVYDDELVTAVKLFQHRHGLTDDGQLGRQTIQAMNVSASDRARQARINMERWRWLPQKLEENHIVVNVPGAWMEVVESGRAVLSMRTIVGSPEHPTPALHATLSSLVLNPAWHVPSSIATKEVLPKLKKDPGYLLDNELEIVGEGIAPGSPESQGLGIDWKSRSTFPWSLRQMPGSDNALGRIKFNMPNSEDIYLHDTPNHKPFARASRALSHGCVRLEHPDELALYLLRDKSWNADKLNQQIDTGETHTVSVSKSIPVWLFYWTMWVDGDGVLQVRDDIYGRDQRLNEALNHAPSAKLEIVSTTPAQPQKTICEGCRIP